MTVTITKNLTKSQVKKLLAKSRSRKKGIDISKFSGKLNWKGNALKVQRSLRND